MKPEEKAKARARRIARRMVRKLHRIRNWRSSAHRPNWAIRPWGSRTPVLGPPRTGHLVREYPVCTCGEWMVRCFGCKRLLCPMVHVRIGAKGDECVSCGTMLNEYSDPPDPDSIGQLHVDEELERWLGALRASKETS
jgi:hypothetical protein